VRTLAKEHISRSSPTALGRHTREHAPQHAIKGPRHSRRGRLDTEVPRTSCTLGKGVLGAGNAKPGDAVDGGDPNGSGLYCDASETRGGWNSGDGSGLSSGSSMLAFKCGQTRSAPPPQARQAGCVSQKSADAKGLRCFSRNDVGAR